VLAACFALSAANLAVLGQPGLAPPLLFTIAFLTGLGIFGGQPGLNAFAAGYYPTELRSTGIGAGLGIGRLGAILGPLIAGELIRRQWPSGDVFRAAVVPALVAMAAMLLMRLAPGPERAAGMDS
jgi:AAHS family 4-hydroxybenzoate transporter-like MFS transporter